MSLFKMKEMMDQFGISEDTLRYYEKMEWNQLLTDYQQKIELQQQELQFIKEMIEMKLKTGEQFGQFDLT